MAQLKNIEDVVSHTCKACKWWIPPSNERFTHGECECTKFVYHPDALPTEQELVDTLEYWDDDGYSASFGTGPDFGCVHWEAK